MSDPNLERVETTLAELATLKKRKQRPNRFHARDLLIGLGARILADEDAEPPELDKVRQATEAFGEDWERAVADELSLACTEHVQGVDPRFLDLPNFDFAYLVAARERLEARFRAVEALGLAVQEDLLQRVAEADRRAEPYLRDEEGA